MSVNLVSKSISIMFRRLLIIILFFLYIYNIGFSFLPSFFNTRSIIGLVGIAYFMYLVKKICFSRHILWLLIIFLGQLIIISLSIIINEHFETGLLTTIPRNILALFGALWLSSIIKNNWVENYNFLGISKIIVWAIAIHSVISVLMFVHPPLMEFFNSIQSFSALREAAIERTMHTRLIGIGNGSFFSGGVQASVGLLLITFIMLSSPKKRLPWIILYVFITVTGFLISRTTVVGNVLSLLMIAYFWMRTSTFLVNIKRLSLMIVLIVLVVIVFDHFYNTFQDDPVFRHGFELFINMQDSGAPQSRSLEIMLTMFHFPDTVKSFLIGDARFYCPSGWHYYMRTDVGYARLMWYWGIFGTILFFLPPLIMSDILWRKEHNNFRFFSFTLLVLFAFVLIVNLKGLVDLNAHYYLFSAHHLFIMRERVSK